MNVKNADIFIRCYRPAEQRRRDNLFLKAVKVAESDPTLKEVLARQMAFDAAMTDEIKALPPVPPELTEQVEAISRASRPRFSLMNPAVVAVLVGLILIASLGVHFGLRQMNDFEGRGATELMIERTASMRGTELEEIKYKAGEIADWLFMQGLEGFPVPDEFKDLHVVGGRVFRQEGFPVVQLAVQENEMIVFLFHQKDFDISLKAEDGWKVFDHEGWAAAVRGDGENGCMIAFLGDRADMSRVLKTYEKK